MKRIVAVCITAALLCPMASADASVPPELSAACAILVDGESGRVLFEKNAHEESAIASITKLMTALVAVENINSLDEKVTILPEWTGIEGSSIYLRAGETVTLEVLLYGLLLNSGNDAAVALAGHCAGNVKTFVEWMNAKAKELGMEHTHFTNPNGLSEDGHYSTAYDMALVARACSENEVVAKVSATKSISFGARTFTNHNKLLWRYDGCNGMKTGYTELSGRTLVTSAQREGLTLIAVTLNAPNDWSDHTALFDYGFKTFSKQTLCTEGQKITQISVQGSLVPFVNATAAENVNYPLAADEKVETRVAMNEIVEAPVNIGTELGKVLFYLENQLIGETNLIADADVKREAVETQSLLERIRNRLDGD